MISRKRLGHGWVGLIFALGGLVHAAQSGQAATAPSSASQPSQTGTAKAKKAKQPKPKFDKGSGESRAERDKRLARECKGKPNAGACEGFGS